MSDFFTGHEKAEERYVEGPMGVAEEFSVLRFAPGPKADPWSYCSLGASLQKPPAEEQLEFIMLSPRRDSRMVKLVRMVGYYHRSEGLAGKADPAVELGGKPEFLATDGKGKAYINLVDKDPVVVVDPWTMKVLKKMANGARRFPGRHVHGSHTAACSLVAERAEADCHERRGWQGLGRDLQGTLVFRLAVDYFYPIVRDVDSMPVKHGTLGSLPRAALWQGRLAMF